MKKFAFMSRHQITEAQKELAAEKGIDLVKIEDLDAFSVTADEIFALAGTDTVGVVIVHPAAALRLCDYFLIGIFENANRAPMGEKPQFIPKDLHLYDMMF